MAKIFQQTYRSSSFSSLVYIKKSMKQILSERTQILKKLNIVPSPKSPANIKQQQQIIQTIITMFKEHPVNLFDHELLVIKEKLRYYVFFSCDDSFIPVCKRCFKTVYFSFSEGWMRIVCTNVACKQCLLESFEIVGEGKEEGEEGIKKGKKLSIGDGGGRNSKSKSRGDNQKGEDIIEKIKRASRNIMK